MNERLRLEIVELHLGGASFRRIARMLGVSRKTVKRVVRELEEARKRGSPHPDLPCPKAKRKSKLDRFDDFVRETLDLYPDITAVRLLEKLEGKGFRGGYTIVRERLKELRPGEGKEPVVRFETAPGKQAQQDHSPYVIDFQRDGRQRVYAFSYILCYSRRQYLRFVRSQDFTTTIREHVRAFDYFGGCAHVCLYDNAKVVVKRWEDDEPIYNTRFLAFAIHYNFRPWACKPRRSQTKGKVERPFDFIAKNLLNARSFQSLEHLNEVTEWWLRTKADPRKHRTTKRRPIDLFEEERQHLRPLPTHPYDTAEVVYRVVDEEGCVAFRNNSYSVPWQLIGELVPVRITEAELFVYGKDLEECARHQLFDRSQSGQSRVLPEHQPRPRERVSREVLLERFGALGAVSRLFLEGLLERRRYAKKEATRILGLLQFYRKTDLIRAIERAQRYGAFSFSAIERILAIQAEPRPAVEAMSEESREYLRELIDGERVEPRTTAEYQHLLDDPLEPGERPA